MAFDVVSIEAVKREAHAAAERGDSLNDSCRWPFESEAGRRFKEFFFTHKAALQALARGSATMSWMITATGAEYHFTGPGAMIDACRPVRIEDIAHHLAQLNRFTGACKRPYSVAEHSLLCSEIAQRAGASLFVQMATLLHDAHEAYTADLSSPAKLAVNYRSIAAGGTQAWTVFETEHAKTVRAHFRLLTVFTSHRALIHEIDLQALATERRDLTAWQAAMHGGWDILGDDASDPAARILPIDWIRLDTPEREAMSWKDWRQLFLDRFEEISFGLSLRSIEGKQRMTRYAQTRVPPARTTKSEFMRGVYTCPELGRTCHRPGAYDAFELPSLYGRRIHFPDGRVIDLPPETSNHRPTPRA